MKRSLTLAIEEEILDRARLAALKRKQTLTKLVRDFLTRLAGEDREREASIRRLVKLMKSRPIEVGPVTWKREDLYER